MPFYFFVWDDENTAHVDEHGITPEEFEGIVRDPDVVEASRSSGRPIAFGYSDAGRYLACVYELLDEATIYPITAFEVEDKQMARPTEISAEKRAELRRVREQIEGERDEIVARGRVHKQVHDAALVEATRMLRTEREAQGLSLADLEARTGMTRAALCRLENAEDANPTIATLNRYAEALGKRLVIGLRSAG